MESFFDDTFHIMNTSESSVDGSYLDLIMSWISSNSNDTDFSKPHLKSSVKYVYPLFVFLHACISLFATSGNVAILVVIIKGQLYKNPTFFYIGNLALADIFQAAVILPITLANLLIQNWIFGSFLCYVLPMMHYFPIHGSMLTYVMLAADRYRIIALPIKSRMPPGLCTVGVWMVAICSVLPFAVYIQYIDLGITLGQVFEGAGICWVNVERNIELYIRAIFVTMYCLPLSVITFLYVKVSAELKHWEPPSVAVRIDDLTDSVTSGSFPPYRTCKDTNQAGRIELDEPSSESVCPPNRVYRHSDDDEDYDDDDDDDIDIHKEKRTQKYMISMITVFAICWCPINIFTLVTHFVHESDDNSAHFDITYLIFTFFGFLSTCMNPVLFSSCYMSNKMKDRLRGYFRFSNKHTNRSQELHIESPHTSELFSFRSTPSPCPSSREDFPRGCAASQNNRRRSNDQEVHECKIEMQKKHGTRENLSHSGVGAKRHGILS